MSQLRSTFTLAAIAAAALASLPAQAVQIAFFGGSNPTNLVTVTGADALGDLWQTSNGPLLLNSSFGMADSAATPQAFNSLNFSNGLGNFATSFQLTVNHSQNGLGFSGINLGPVASGFVNHFTTMGSVGNPATWVDWLVSYDLADAVTGLYQQVRFTAPTGTRLDQGQAFSVDVNFAGIMTNDSGWAASFNDTTSAVPEPSSLALLGLGLAGIAVVRRRLRKSN